MSNAIKIKVLLCGGLGNQLFQYSFAKALALRSAATLELDAATLFSQDTQYRRSYSLDDFHIPASVSIIRKIRISACWREKLLRFFDQGRSLHARRVVEEPRPMQFYEGYHNWRAKHSVTLIGYWQCPHYFQDIEFQLREDLQFREPGCSSLKELSEKILGENAVAVHVRRTQYGRCLAPKYYEAAISRMRAMLDDPNFYVISDSPNWWQQNIRQYNDVQIIHNHAFSDIEYFKLMTHCKHFIIANSSFSWWAAWLGNYVDKRVIAPSSVIWDNPDILCSSWIPLSVTRAGDLI
jgi:hypothetical protein